MRHMRSRRILAMLLALSMIFGLLTTTAFAGEVDQNTSNVGESAANGTSEGGSGEGQSSGASEDESSKVTNKEDVPTEEETTPEEKKTTSDEEVDTQEGEGENAVALNDYITVNNGETQYATLEAAIAAAEPENGVITYTVHGSVHVEKDGWIEIVKSGLTDITKVEFVGSGENAEISTDAEDSILNEQTYGVDVIFNNLTLSHPNGKWVGNTGHGAVYFTTWVHDSSKTVTYTNCKFPNGACNNQYGKTVYDNCSFENATTGLYNLWVYGGNVELNGGKFTGTRGAKVYTEGDPSAKTPMTVEINGTSFEGLNEKAAIVVSKAATVTLSDVTTTDCTKGTFQKDIEGSSDDEQVTITANGTGISGSFNVTSEKNAEAAKSEFNISAGTFNVPVSKDYLADGCTIDENGNVSNSTEKVVAKIGDATYTSLTDALANVTAETPLTWVDDSVWAVDTPVYYAGNFYSNIDELLYYAQQNKGVITPDSTDEAVIYCRPNANITNGNFSHASYVTNTTIYGNGATLSGATEWDVENYYTLTKDITINIYNLNGGASVWGTRKSDYTVTVNMIGCEDAHEVLFNYGSGNGRVIVTVKDCTFLKSGGAAHGWPVSINCLGSLTVDGCTFDGVITGVVVNVKQPSENG